MSRKAVSKRDAIMRAAIEIMNAKSFALATMVEIAAALNLRDATLYYYFPNKQALAYACHCHSLQRFERIVNTAGASANVTGGEKLRLVAEGLLVESERNGPLLYFGDYTYLESPQRKIITAWSERLRASVEQILREGMADGSVRECDPELVVHLLLGMLIWLGKWTPSIKDLTANRLMQAISTFGFEGLDNSAPQKR